MDYPHSHTSNLVASSLGILPMRLIPLPLATAALLCEPCGLLVTLQEVAHGPPVIWFRKICPSCCGSSVSYIRNFLDFVSNNALIRRSSEFATYFTSFLVNWQAYSSHKIFVNYSYFEVRPPPVI